MRSLQGADRAAYLFDSVWRHGTHDMGFAKADNTCGGTIGLNRETLFDTYFPRETGAKRREFGGTFDPDRHGNSWYHFESAG